MKVSRISCYVVLICSLTCFHIQRISGAIREDIADKYKKRYQEWRDDFVSTETGRKQWDSYSLNTRFSLGITVSGDNLKGGETSKFKWDEEGNLIAATITLGGQINQGYPNPIYYPVMNSLAQCETSILESGNLLAAAKIAHEFGHVNRMLTANGATFRLQNQLMPVYNSILLSNGRNTRDARLLDLARQMGGTPVEIWEDREYWGETNAMLYLRDRVARESFQCALFNRIRRSVDLYAKNYEDRFVEIAQSNQPPGQCGWR